MYSFASPKASPRHHEVNAEHGGNGNVLRDSPVDLETQGRDSRPGAGAQGRAPQSLCAANRPPRRACRAGIRKGSGSLHSLESHSGVTSEFERVVRPRGSGAANMRAGSLPFWCQVCRPAPPAAAPRGSGWRLSANPEHRSIGDRFLICEVAIGDVATFTPEFHMRHITS
jgi:hypothetical protein